ncbi:MAG TPA: 30S ribosomal protein S8 [Anaerolineales bacterium]|nr:30S ribosomal protein S8 [Anaerolineae bacterium]HIP87690.1 30S ribosomal protein S8 [Anaerolineales bacterium]
MTVTDPIADMLTRIRNAIAVGHPTVEMPSSKMKVAIARILKEEGFIEDYEVREYDEQPRYRLLIRLKYVGERRNRRPVIRGLKRVSKPGRRIYTKARDIPWVRSGMGIAILTTPKGVLTGQQARRLGVGGEIICYVW